MKRRVVAGTLTITDEEKTKTTVKPRPGNPPFNYRVYGCFMSRRHRVTDENVQLDRMQQILGTGGPIRTEKLGQTFRKEQFCSQPVFETSES